MNQFNPQRRGSYYQQGKGGGPTKDQRAETVEKLWPGYLSNGYFDACGNLHVVYVSRERVEPLVRAMCDAGAGLTTHQIRRYFGHCRTVETRLKSGGASWASVLPEIKKLDYAADDGFGKRPPKIPALFHDFICRNVAAIKEENDFLRGFLPHFEALMGFGTAHFRRERN